MKKRVVKEFVIWLLWILFAFLLSRFLNAHVLVNAQVLTGSMESTIMASHRVFGFRTSYLFSEPARGDIIVFPSPIPDEYTTPFIKRIIGLGGEELMIVSGIVYINGARLNESYAEVNIPQDFGPVVIPYGQVFVMGDNRDFSRDSREWGAIDIGDIIGRIYLDFSPLPSFIANYTFQEE